jgi:hypothetical protein
MPRLVNGSTAIDRLAAAIVLPAGLVDDGNYACGGLAIDAAHGH